MDQRWLDAGWTLARRWMEDAGWTREIKLLRGDSRLDVIALTGWQCCCAGLRYDYE